MEADKNSKNPFGSKKQNFQIPTLAVNKAQQNNQNGKNYQMTSREE